jgi:hypothetical protein
VCVLAFMLLCAWLRNEQVCEREFVGAAATAGFSAAEVRALLAHAEAKNIVMVSNATIYVI